MGQIIVNRRLRRTRFAGGGFSLTSAVVENSDKDALNLSFSKAATITTSGWSISTDGAALSISGVTGSGTTTPVFSLSRDITNGEVITISYDPASGSTTDPTGQELAELTSFSVTNNVQPGSIIIVEDNFAGTVIDTSKWTETDPDGLISQNNALIGTADGTTSSRANYLNLDTNAPSTFAVSVNVIGGGLTFVTPWIDIWDGTNSNEIVLLGSSSDYTKARIVIRDGGSTVYDFNPQTVNMDNRWKILKSGNNVSIYYWSGSWVQFGATQVVTLPTLTPSLQFVSALGGGQTTTIDDFYLTSADYATEVPT